MAPFAHLHVLYGEDDFRKLEALRALLAQVAPLDVRDFNYDRIDAKLAEPGTIRRISETPPMLADRRVLHLDDMDQIKADQLRELLAVIDEAAERNASDFVLILLYAGGKKPPKEILSRTAKAQEFPDLKWKDATAWVSDYARSRYQRTLPFDAVRALVTNVGAASSGALAKEIDKLHGMAGESPITVELVNQVSPPAHGASVYDLCDAIGMRQRGKALKLVGDVLQHPEFNGIRISITLGIHLVNLGVARTRIDAGEPKASVQRRFGWTGEKVVAQAAQWSRLQLDHALDCLLEADLRMKTGGTDLNILQTFITDALVPGTPSR